VRVTNFCLSNAMHSSIGQNIKSLDVSDVRCPMSNVWPECEKLQMAITQQCVTRSISCLVLGWGSKQGLNCSWVTWTLLW